MWRHSKGASKINCGPFHIHNSFLHTRAKNSFPSKLILYVVYLRVCVFQIVYPPTPPLFLIVGMRGCVTLCFLKMVKYLQVLCIPFLSPPLICPPRLSVLCYFHTSVCLPSFSVSTFGTAAAVLYAEILVSPAVPRPHKYTRFRPSIILCVCGLWCLLSENVNNSCKSTSLKVNFCLCPFPSSRTTTFAPLSRSLCHSLHYKPGYKNGTYTRVPPRAEIVFYRRRRRVEDQGGL